MMSHSSDVCVQNRKWIYHPNAELRNQGFWSAVKTVALIKREKSSIRVSRGCSLATRRSVYLPPIDCVVNINANRLHTWNCIHADRNVVQCWILVFLARCVKNNIRVPGEVFAQARVRGAAGFVQSGSALKSWNKGLGVLHSDNRMVRSLRLADDEACIAPCLCP